MVISEQLEKIPKPRVYNRKGTDCFYDSYRENMVPATPEEEVRQKLLVWLEKECHVPKKRRKEYLKDRHDNAQRTKES